MKKFALILFGLLMLPVTGFAQTAPDAAFEQRVSQILQERLNLRSNIQALDAGGTDLAVKTLIEGTPQVALIGNARIAGNREDGSPSQLSFSVILLPDAKSMADRQTVLEFANRWNGQILPLRIVAQPDTVAMVSSRLIDLNHPMQEDEVVGMYIFMMQTWQTVLNDLKANAILP